MDPLSNDQQRVNKQPMIFRQVREDEELKNVMEETFKTPEIQSRDIGAAQQKVASIFISESQKVQVCHDAFSSDCSGKT